jgi:signal transduction histidine kinase
VLPQFDTEDLASFAAAAGETFDASVIITGRTADGSPSLAGAAGVGRERLAALWPRLEIFEAEPHDAGGEELSAMPDLIRSRWLPPGEAEPITTVTMRMDTVELGAVHLLGAEEGTDLNLLRAIVSHVAWAFARRRLRHREQIPGDDIVQPAAVVGMLTAASAHRPVDLLGRVHAVMTEAFGQVAVGITAWDADRGVLRLMPGSFGYPVGKGAWSQSKLDSMASVTARTFRFRRSYLTNDLATEPQDPPTSRWRRFSALLACPLVVGDRAVGVLHVRKEVGKFDLRDLHAAEFLARPIAPAVELTATLSRLQLQNGMESSVSKIAVVLADGAEIGDQIPAALEELRAISDAQIVSLAQGHAEPVVAREGGVSDAAVAAAIEAARGAATQHVEVTPSSPGGPSTARLLIPILLAGRPYGGLVVVREHALGFSEMERRCFARLADLVALGLAGRRDFHQRTSLARLEERERLADQLHDDVAQILFAAQIQLDTLLEQEDIDAGVAEGVKRARALLVRGDQQIRRVINDLPRTTSDEDLRVRLRAIVDDISDSFAIEVEVEVAEAAVDWMREADAEHGEAMLRIARECLVNAAKHAEVDHARIVMDLLAADLLRVVVSDGGVGLPAGARDRSGHGLATIKRIAYRHGWGLEVGPVDRGGGTAVILDIPV